MKLKKTFNQGSSNYKFKGRKRLPPGHSCRNTLFGVYKTQAYNRDLDFKLSLEEFEKLTKENCFYCGIEPKQKFQNPNSNGAFTYNGIDRVNNQQGYFLENCVPCCIRCNRMKSNMTLRDFVGHLKKILVYLHSGKSQTKT